jgi:hypothetical protein
MSKKKIKYIGNLIESIEQPPGLHGKLIYLEEDLEVSSNFLKFMNEALEKYQNHSQVFSIIGGVAPIRPDRLLPVDGSCG